MIKIENIVTPSPEQWKSIIMGARNPMNSWDRSDSTFAPKFHMGEKDHELLLKLAKSGGPHAKYRRMIVVYMDITAPLYWWKEFDQSKVGTVTNSCSTMHKLLSEPFEMNNFSFDKLPGYRREVKQYRPIIDEDMERSEVWVHVDSEYDVSNYGRVRHNFKNHSRILSGSLHLDGYLLVTLHGKQTPVHRLVAEAFHSEEYADGLCVNHKDGNKQNNFAENLEWVTISENCKHAIDNGLTPKRVKTYSGKFSEKERDKIKAEWDSGEISVRKIAEKYGVSHTCIYDIINDKYKYADKQNLYKEVAKPYVDLLNELRDSYLRANDESAKTIIWNSIIQALPSSYNQKRTVMLNYEVLSAMYRDRRNHRLDEWVEFCKIIETLPYSELITCEAKKEVEQ